MELNTVFISLERLKELELAEQKLKEPRSKTVLINRGCGFSYIVETDEECVEKLANDLVSTKSNNEFLRDQGCKYSLEIIELKQEISKISLMSFWKFYKWRKNINIK